MTNDKEYIKKLAKYFKDNNMEDVFYAVVHCDEFSPEFKIKILDQIINTIINQ